MGRYYSGDIEGKFMFAVQPSDAGERFYAREEEPTEIRYVVNYEDIDKVRKAVDSVDKDSILRVGKMFADSLGYNDDTMKKYKVSEYDLREYADYQLGLQILEYLEEEQSDCCFYAEL